MLMGLIQSIEVRLALALALLGLVVSPIVGIISGIPFGLLLIRTILLSFLMGGVGFGTLYVLKRFVPEVYTVFAGSSSAASNMNPEEIETGIAEGESEDEGFESEQSLTEGEESGLESSTPSEYDPGLDTPQNDGVASRKVGRHILEEKGIKYEPKIMAEAIRTMMSKDED